MKKTISILALFLILVQMLCFHGVLAQTETTTAMDTANTTEATTTVVTTESTTMATTTEATEQTTTESTQETTEATTTAPTNETTANTPTQTVSTQLIILEEKGKVAARLTDQNGNAVAGVKVDIQMGSTSLPGIMTDANGYAVFSYDMPTDNSYIYCSTEDTLIGNILYTSTAASAGKRATAQQTQITTTEKTTVATTTATPTYNRTTKATSSPSTTEAETWYTNVATTATENTYISIGFNFSDKVLKLFDITNEKFANTAKLLLSPKAYDTIISDMTGTLLMSVNTSETEVTDEQITEVLKDDPVLSLTEPQDIERLVIEMSLQVENSIGEQTDIWTLAADDYVVQLPVPHSMRSAKTIAVAAINESGISEPVYATVSKDGFLRFETTAPAGTLVLLGFKNNWLAAFTSDSAVTSIIFGVFGILCIGGAVFLYIYFFFLPKRAKKKEAEENNADSLTEENLEEEPEIDELETEGLETEGLEAEEPEIEQPEAEEPYTLEDVLLEESEDSDPLGLGGLDIFSDTDFEEAPTPNKHSDIDIPL